MDSSRPLLNTTAALHEWERVSEQLSPTVQLILILTLLTFGLSIAYFQVVIGRKEAASSHEPTPASTALKMARIFILNGVSGCLIMMATSIGAYDAVIASIRTDLHDFLDPRLMQWKVDCFRVHALHWVRYSSGWQSLASHVYNVHLWAMPAEFIAAMFFFSGLVLLPSPRNRLSVALAVSCLAYGNFWSSWIAWLCFASLFFAHSRALQPDQDSPIPLTEYKGRKVYPHQGSHFLNGRAVSIATMVLALYLLSAPKYGFGKVETLVSQLLMLILNSRT